MQAFKAMLCADNALFSVVRGKDPACFARCGSNDFNITSDCFITCFYNTLFQKGVTKDELVTPWEAAFTSCPALPPWTPPPAVRLPNLG